LNSWAPRKEKALEVRHDDKAHPIVEKVRANEAMAQKCVMRESGDKLPSPAFG